jgi:hypothetical protein
VAYGIAVFHLASRSGWRNRLFVFGSGTKARSRWTFALRQRKAAIWRRIFPVDDNAMATSRSQIPANAGNLT